MSCFKDDGMTPLMAAIRYSSCDRPGVAAELLIAGCPVPVTFVSSLTTTSRVCPVPACRAVIPLSLQSLHTLKYCPIKTSIYAALVFNRRRLPAELASEIFTYLSCRDWAACPAVKRSQPPTVVGSKRGRILT